MNQRLGYARASADDQNLDRQLDSLRGAGVSFIYEDLGTSNRAGWPQLERCLHSLKANDTLVVWRLDRLGRNLGELIRLVAALSERGIGVESLTEALTTAGDSGKPVARIFNDLAEAGRQLIRERTHSGLSAIRSRGRAGGRKPKLNTQQIEEVRRLMADPTIPVGQIAARYQVSRTTLYKVAPQHTILSVESREDRTGLTP